MLEQQLEAEKTVFPAEISVSETPAKDLSKEKTFTILPVEVAVMGCETPAKDLAKGQKREGDGQVNTGTKRRSAFNESAVVAHVSRVRSARKIPPPKKYPRISAADKSRTSSLRLLPDLLAVPSTPGSSENATGKHATRTSQIQSAAKESAPRNSSLGLLNDLLNITRPLADSPLLPERMHH